MGTEHLLLLDALVQPPTSALESWNLWRKTADLDKLDYESFVMVPALAGRIEEWLLADPHGAILRGICRRAWSQNQVRIQSFTFAAGLLREAGLGPVAAIGPLAWSLGCWPERSIRPIGSVDLLVEPRQAAPALDAFLRAGFTSPDAPSPRRERVGAGSGYFAPPLRLEHLQQGWIRLHWRAMPNTSFSLRPQPPLRLVPLRSGPHQLLTTPPEESFVSALSGAFDDGMDWQCDATILAQHPEIDWHRVGAELRHRPNLRRRLRQLVNRRRISAPEQATRPGWTLCLEPAAALLRLYRRARASSRP